MVISQDTLHKVSPTTQIKHIIDTVLVFVTFFALSHR